MSNKLFLWLTFLFFILITFFSFQISFFWDGTFFSELAVHFYDHGFNGFIAPQNIDTGGFPLYSSYLALVWKFFGKSLFVSHLALLPFILGIAFEYFKLAIKFLDKKIIPLAMLLLICEPTLVTQSILMGYDLLMVYFFMLALNSLLSKKFQLLSSSLLFLSLSSIRGEMFFVSFFVLEYVMFKKINFKNYFPALFFICFWWIYHYQNTEWFFFSPEREKTHENISGLTMMVRQLLFIGWKLADFGRFLLLLFFVVGGILICRKTKNHQLKKLGCILFIPLSVLCLFMVLIENPIGHKYFIVSFLCLNIGVCFLLQLLKNKKLIKVLSVIFCLALLSGNFWLYPEKYGNGWDSSLKIVPYFKLQTYMDEYVKAAKIDERLIGTQFPLIANKKYSHLQETDSHYTNVWAGPVNKFQYYLYSNIINTDIDDQIKLVREHWELLRTFHAGQITISLYKNEMD